jgi:pimeloyl-ACP methyl ester carboxylesterase
MHLPSRHLLFLPGAGADPDFWRPVGERLPSVWEKIYLGWPGIGHNAPEPGIDSFEALMEFAEAKLLGAFSSDAKVDVLAQSMGGAVALALCLRHPEKVDRLVLSVTSGELDVASLGAKDWRTEYRREYPHAAEWLYQARPDYSEELSSVKQPTLLLWGDCDPISPIAVGQKLQEALPCAELVVVEGGTHALAAERASEVATHVTRHLTGSESLSPVYPNRAR